MTDAAPPRVPPYGRLLVLSSLAGAAIMVSELAAPRLTAPHLGTGLLGWSAVLAVFLAGLGLGNVIGGRLADRGGARTLPALFAAAGVLVALAVPLDLWLRGGALAHVGHAPRVLLAVAIAFGPGAVGCGLVGPALGRAVLAAKRRPGRAIGMIGAASAVGSVVGTFVTGFVLVPHLGTRAILLGAAGLLLGCAALAWGLPVARREATASSNGRTPRDAIWLAALAGAALLMLEVIAARVAAGRLGTSLYTWTSVLGIVLLALALGGAWGGRLADRLPPRALLGKLLLASSLGVASCLWTPALMEHVLDLDVPWALRTALAVGAAFLVPALLLGTLTPVIIKDALGDPAADGRTVGRLYAAGTWGAVAGSLLAGFVLIPLLQVPLLLVFLALVLALAAGRRTERLEVPWLATLGLVACLIALPLDVVRDLGLRLGVREDRPGVHVEDSRYFHILVEPYEVRWVRLRAPLDPHTVSTWLEDPLLAGRVSYDAERRRLRWQGPMRPAQLARLRTDIGDVAGREAVRALHKRIQHDVEMLSLDHFVHGFVDLQDPLWLEYDYEILTAAIVRALWPTGAGDVHAFFIGGGAYTFQRRLASLYPERAKLFTAEIDPAVTRVAVERMGLRLRSSDRVLHGDARTVLSKFGHKAWHFDFVFGDAFHDLGVPWHLTTQAFAEEVRGRLTPHGVYLVNVIDTLESGRFLGAFVNTLAGVFRHVRVLHLAGGDKRVQETFLLAASDEPLTWNALTDDDGMLLDVREIADQDLRDLVGRAGRRVLTDDHAPVEWLLAPVVRGPTVGRRRAVR